MKTLQISEKDAKKLYKTASKEFKVVLEETFGKEFFMEDIRDRIKTFKDAVNYINSVSGTLVDNNLYYYNNLDYCKDLSKDEIAYGKLKLIAEALNEGWVPDWKDGNQKKFVPHFNTLSPSGFAFFSTSYRYSYPSAGYASRLCFKSDELAKYAGIQFLKLYKDFILG
jgi:hypothetical protein